TEEIAAVIVGRHEDLVAGADFQGPQGQFDGEGAARAGDGKLDRVKAGKAFLQAPDGTAVVFAPGAVHVSRLERLENVVVGQWPGRRPLGTRARTTEQGR